LAEVAVVVPLPPPPAGPAWRARDLVVAIGKDAVRVGIKGQPPILDVSWLCGAGAGEEG
jgi:hypothetical protein